MAVQVVHLKENLTVSFFFSVKKEQNVISRGLILSPAMIIAAGTKNMLVKKIKPPVENEETVMFYF